MNDERGHNGDNGARGGWPLDALLSAYLDDRESLSAEELERVESLLASDAEARRAYAQLQVIVGELGRLEPVAAPRSFHLDADMLGAPEPAPVAAGSAWYVRHVGAIRWATAAAAVLFVFVLSADLVLNGIFADRSSDTSGADSAPFTQSQLAEPESAEEAAPYIASDIEESDDAATDSAAALEAPSQDADAAAKDAAGGDDAVEAEEDSSAGEGAMEAAGGAESVSPPDAVPTAEIAIAQDGDEQADTARTTDAVADDEARALDTLAFEEQAARSDDDGSGRRLWRIAEFGLVMTLALLITALIILPRMARAPTRR